MMCGAPAWIVQGSAAGRSSGDDLRYFPTSRRRCVSAEIVQGRRRVARNLRPVGEDAQRRDREGIGRKTPTF
jgi:hypothetical protein